MVPKSTLSILGWNIGTIWVLVGTKAKNGDCPDQISLLTAFCSKFRVSVVSMSSCFASVVFLIA